MWRMSFVRVGRLNEARNEFLAFLKFYKTEVGAPYVKNLRIRFFMS